MTEQKQIQKKIQCQANSKVFSVLSSKTELKVSKIYIVKLLDTMLDEVLLFANNFSECHYNLTQSSVSQDHPCLFCVYSYSFFFSFVQNFSFAQV